MAEARSTHDPSSVHPPGIPRNCLDTKVGGAECRKAELPGKEFLVDRAFPSLEAAQTASRHRHEVRRGIDGKGRQRGPDGKLAARLKRQRREEPFPSSGSTLILPEGRVRLSSRIRCLQLEDGGSSGGLPAKRASSMVKAPRRLPIQARDSRYRRASYAIRDTQTAATSARAVSAGI